MPNAMAWAFICIQHTPECDISPLGRHHILMVAPLAVSWDVCGFPNEVRNATLSGPLEASTFLIYHLPAPSCEHRLSSAMVLGTSGEHLSCIVLSKHLAKERCLMFMCAYSALSHTYQRQPLIEIAWTLAITPISQQHWECSKVTRGPYPWRRLTASHCLQRCVNGTPILPPPWDRMLYSVSGLATGNKVL